MRGVTFIIPFRSKATCRDWEAVSGALRGTLASIANQSSSGYRCILACHEPPDGFVARPWLAVVEVSSPRPAGPAEYKGDKRAKLVAGLREYLRDPTELYMILDADDRVHAELARHVGGADAPTYLVDKGYVYAGGRWVRAHNGTFDRLCGSICVSNREDAATGFVPSFSGHFNVRSEFARRGLPLARVPFFAVLKNVGYGDNSTETRFLMSESVRRTLKKLAMMRPVTPAIRRSFALDTDPDPSDAWHGMHHGAEPQANAAPG